MAGTAKQNSDLQQLLRPFYQRASEAEDRLSILEAALSNKKDTRNEECLEKVKELQSKLEEVTAELAAERLRVAKLTLENEKKDYRITHLVRSLRVADSKPDMA